MSDPVYTKLRYSELEIDLMKRLVKATKVLDKIQERDCYKTNKILPSGASAYEFANRYDNQLRAAEEVAGQAIDELTSNLSDDDWDLMYLIRQGKI